MGKNVIEEIIKNWSKTDEKFGLKKTVEKKLVKKR